MYNLTMLKITTSPLDRTLAERGITIKQFSQLTGLSEIVIHNMKKGRTMKLSNIDIICRVLNCQPCDVIEFKKDGVSGHWEWVSD